MSANFYDLGYQHYLTIQHVPDTIASNYPTRDKHSAEEEAEFLRGYLQAKSDLEIAKAEVRLFGEARFD